MAWIESHQSLGGHLKLRRLARELRIHRAQAIGHLHFLWWWALDNAPTGNLSALAPAEIAEVAEWPGSEDQFLAALKSCGWIDENGEIHDWADYAGKIVTSRQSNRERQRLARERNASVTRDVTADPSLRNASVTRDVTADPSLRNASVTRDVTADPSLRNASVTRDVTADPSLRNASVTRDVTADPSLRNASVTGLPNPTQPNPTVPNPTQPLLPISPPMTPPTDGGIEEEIYQAYPRKVAKPDAIRAIRKALKEVEPEKLLELTKAYAAARSAADPQFTPHPATWFNGRRYADDPSTWHAVPRANGYHDNTGGKAEWLAQSATQLTGGDDCPVG
jgi:hypothetical protein